MGPWPSARAATVDQLWSPVVFMAFTSLYNDLSVFHMYIWIVLVLPCVRAALFFPVLQLFLKGIKSKGKSKKLMNDIA